MPRAEPGRAEVERVSRAAPSRGERAAHARTGVTQPARLRGVSWKPQPCAESEVLWKSIVIQR